MASVSQQIMEYAEALPEGTLIRPGSLLHLGSRPAVYKALSRLTRQYELMRVCRGIYAKNFDSRFGKCRPDPKKVIAALSEFWGETIVPSGGGAANFLGLTEQVPMMLSYLTSGPSRELNFYAKANLHHAPRWQLVAPGRAAGTLIRALTFLHPFEAPEAFGKVLPQFSEEEMSELLALRSVLPEWIVKPLNAYVNHGTVQTPEAPSA